MLKRVIKWDNQAISFFKEAIAFIKKDSFQNAEKVKSGILSEIRNLAITLKNIPPISIKKTITVNIEFLSCLDTELHTW